MVTQNDLVFLELNWFPEDGAVKDEGVKSSVLAARIHARRKFREKFFIENSPDKFPIHPDLGEMIFAMFSHFFQKEITEDDRRDSM